MRACARTFCVQRDIVFKALANPTLPPFSHPFQLPFPPNEHHLAPGVLDVSVSVYDDEPSSIIAYTLASRAYFDFLKLRAEHKKAQRQAKPEGASKKRTANFYADAAVQPSPAANVQVRRLLHAIGRQGLFKCGRQSLFKP